MSSIRLREYDRELMNLLLRFPALSSNHIGLIMRNLGYERSEKRNISRLRQLCGAKENSPDMKYGHRRLNKKGYLLTCNWYRGIEFGAERGECLPVRSGMYSLTQAGRDLLGVDVGLPARSNRYLWAYYYQSALLLRSLEAGIPLSVMSPALGYKRINNIHYYVPIWFLYSMPRGAVCVTFLTSAEPGLGPGWPGVMNFAQSGHGRFEDYVVLVPMSRYMYAINGLVRRSAYRTYLLPYGEAVGVLRNILYSSEYYVDELANYLGVSDYVSSGGIGYGMFRGCRVRLCEFVSGYMRTLRYLDRGLDGFREPTYCLVREWQYNHVNLLPRHSDYHYVIYERMGEAY